MNIRQPPLHVFNNIITFLKQKLFMLAFIFIAHKEFFITIFKLYLLKSKVKICLSFCLRNKVINYNYPLIINQKSM